jgi:hypothetical protein
LVSSILKDSTAAKYITVDRIQNRLDEVGWHKDKEASILIVPDRTGYF